MNTQMLVIRNIIQNPFRTWVVALCAFLTACISISAVVVYRGADDTLRLVNERLGADIMVIPAGTQSSIENALLMGVPASVWMDRNILKSISIIPGVEIVSPQLFLSTMRGASCCSVSDMFMIAYDPATDFTVRAWLDDHLGRELKLNEAIGGCFVYIPESRKNILVYGNEIELVGHLAPTGSGLDQSMFITFDTAMEISRLSPMQAERELYISPDSISAALIKVASDADTHEVAVQIAGALEEVTVIESSNIFSVQRIRISQILSSFAALVLLTWIMSVVVIGLVTSAAVSERRQQIGVLRALGAARIQIFRSLLLEGELIALTGSIAGIAFSFFGIFLFRNLISQKIGTPILFPDVTMIILYSCTVLILISAGIFASTFYPILLLTSKEPGTSMKEG